MLIAKVIIKRARSKLFIVKNIKYPLKINKTSILNMKKKRQTVIELRH